MNENFNNLIFCKSMLHWLCWPALLFDDTFQSFECSKAYRQPLHSPFPPWADYRLLCIRLHCEPLNPLCMMGLVLSVLSRIAALLLSRYTMFQDTWWQFPISRHATNNKNEKIKSYSVYIGNLPGHRSMLQGCVSWSVREGHGWPPFFGGIQNRVLVCIPPIPHDTVHSDHSSQSPQAQLTVSGPITYLWSKNSNIG